MRKISSLVLVSSITISGLFAPTIYAEEFVCDEVTANEISKGARLIRRGAIDITTVLLEFIWNRVPNTKEILYDIPLGAVVEIGLKKAGLKFDNNNAAAKSIIRDISKVPSAILKALDDVEVGSTGVKFDAANVVSAIVKPATKAACIAFLQERGYETNDASQICNYPGDFVARIFVVAGKDKQKAKHNASFPRYFVEEFNAGWIARPLMQEPTKNYVVAQISRVYAHYKIGDLVSSTVRGLANTAKFMVVRRGYRFGGSACAVGSFAVDFVATGAVQFVSTISLATPARIMFDVVDWANSAVKEKYSRSIL